MVPGKLPRPGLRAAALAAAEVAVVAVVGFRYGSDGLLATVAALVLAPVAVGITWLLAERVAGRGFADCAAAVYVALPALGAFALLGSYRSTYAEHALPNLVGLRATPWFALGLALGAIMLIRRAGPALALAGVVLLAGSRGDLGALRAGLHETAWSIAMLQWLALAGIVGVTRRSPWHAAGLGGWLAAAVAVGARHDYSGAAFWQSLAVAMPAAAILLSALWLLVPPLRVAPAPSSAN